MDALQVAMQRAKFARQTPATNTLKTVESPKKETKQIPANDLEGRIASVESRVEQLINNLQGANVALKNEIFSPPGYLSMREIRRIIAEYFSVTVHDIDAARRDARSCYVRMIGYYLCKNHTLHSLPMIGKVFGNRDHTTILNGIRRVVHRRKTNPELDRDIAAIEKVIAAAIAQRGDIPSG